MVFTPPRCARKASGSRLSSFRGRQRCIAGAMSDGRPRGDSSSSSGAINPRCWRRPTRLINGVTTMPSLTVPGDVDRSLRSAYPATASSDGARPRTSRTANEPVPRLARLQRRMVGRVVALAGSFNILVGTILADQHRAARGHRQRVAGMLQLNCEVDRRTVEAFVDRWLSSTTTMR